jgi:hypothetical protein
MPFAAFAANGVSCLHPHFCPFGLRHPVFSESE